MKRPEATECDGFKKRTFLIRIFSIGSMLTRESNWSGQEFASLLQPVRKLLADLIQIRDREIALGEIKGVRNPVEYALRITSER